MSRANYQYFSAVFLERLYNIVQRWVEHPTFGLRNGETVQNLTLYWTVLGRTYLSRPMTNFLRDVNSFLVLLGGCFETASRLEEWLTNGMKQFTDLRNLLIIELNSYACDLMTFASIYIILSNIFRPINYQGHNVIYNYHSRYSNSVIWNRVWICIAIITVYFQCIRNRIGTLIDSRVEQMWIGREYLHKRFGSRHFELLE